MLRKILTITAITIVTLVFFSIQVQAEVLILDWDKAWKLALEKNEAIADARDEVAKADHLIGEAYAGAMPTVSMSGAFMHYFDIPMSIMQLPSEMNSDQGPLRLKIPSGTENTTSFSLEVNQPLYVAGKVGIALEIAKHYQRLSELGIKVSRTDLRYSLTELFYSSLLADEYLKVSQEAMDQAERLNRQTRSLFEQGMISEYDLIRANVAVANLKPQVIQAEIGKNLAYKSLKNLIGIDVDRELILKGELDQSSTTLGEYETGIRRALEDRVEFQQLDLQAKLYEGQYKIEKRSSLWPSVFLGFKWQTLAQADDYKFNKYQFLDGFSGSLALQVPLFDGWASSHRAEKVKIDLRKVHRQKKMFERGVKIQVYQALSDFNKAGEELQAAEETVKQAEKGLSIAELRYKEGVGTQLEALDAQLQLNNSRINLLQAKYNRLISKAAYERAVGMSYNGNR